MSFFSHSKIHQAGRFWPASHMFDTPALMPYMDIQTGFLTLLSHFLITSRNTSWSWFISVTA